MDDRDGARAREQLRQQRPGLAPPGSMCSEGADSMPTERHLSVITMFPGRGILAYTGTRGCKRTLHW